MVRETRHLWVGNLPENVREEKIIEHFKRYGRVESVKVLPKRGSEGGVAAFVDFVDIKSAQKAHNAINKMGDRDLRTDYNEPGTIPSAARGLDDNLSIGSRGRDVSGFTRAPVGGVYGTPTSLHSRDGRYERRLDGSAESRERQYDHGAYGHHERQGSSFERQRHYDTDYYSRERTLSASGNGSGTSIGSNTTLSAGVGSIVNAVAGHTGTSGAVAAATGASGGSATSGVSFYRSHSRSPCRFGTPEPRYESRTREAFTLASVVHRDLYREDRARRSERSFQDSRSRSPLLAHSQNPSPQRLASHASRHPRSHSVSGSRSRSSSSDSVSSTSSSTSGSDSSSSSSDESPARSVQSAAVPAPSALPLSSRDKEEPRKSFGIKVQNLPVRSTDTSLKDGLFHEFKKHGKVTSVQIHGASEERYGLVFFRQQEDQEKALGASKGKLFFGMQIDVTAWNGPETESENEFRPLDERIDEFHPKATRTLFIGNLEKTTTYHDLLSIFQRFGEIVDIDIKKVNGAPQYAFLQYCDIASVCKAIKKMDGEYLGNNRLKLGFGKSMPTTCVWLDGLASNTTEQFLTRHFCRYGHVVKVVFDRMKGMALILYNNIEYAQAAVKDTKGWKIGGSKIKVDFANQESQMAFYRSMQASGQDIRDFYDILSERRDERRSQYEFQVERPYYENVRTPGTYAEDPRRKYTSRSREFYADWDPYQGDYYETQYYEDTREYREYRADPYEQDIRKYSYLQRERERERERFETDRGRDHGRRTIERSQSPALVASRRAPTPIASPSISERIASDSDRRICCPSSERSGSCSSLSPPRFEKVEKTRIERYNKINKVEKGVCEVEKVYLVEKEKRAGRNDRGDKDKIERQRLKKLKVSSPINLTCDVEPDSDRDMSPESALQTKAGKILKDSSSRGKLDLLPCVVQLTRVKEEEGKLITHENQISRTENDSPRLVSPPADQRSPLFRTESLKGNVKGPRDKNMHRLVEHNDIEIKMKPKKLGKCEIGFESGVSIDFDRLAARKRRFEDSGHNDHQKRISEDDLGRTVLPKSWNNNDSGFHKNVFIKKMQKREQNRNTSAQIFPLHSPNDGQDSENDSTSLALQLPSQHGLPADSSEPFHSPFLKMKLVHSKSENSSSLTKTSSDGSLDFNEIKEKRVLGDKDQSGRNCRDSENEEQFVCLDQTNTFTKHTTEQSRCLQAKLCDVEKSDKCDHTPRDETQDFGIEYALHDIRKPNQDINTDDFSLCKRNKVDNIDSKTEQNFVTCRKLNEGIFHHATPSTVPISLRREEETTQISISDLNTETKSSLTKEHFLHAQSLKSNMVLKSRHFQTPESESEKLKASFLGGNEDFMSSWLGRVSSDTPKMEPTSQSESVSKCQRQDLEPGEVQSDSDDDGERKQISHKSSSSLSYILREHDERMTDLKLCGSLEKNKFYSFALDKTITPDTKALLERAKTLYSSREDNWSFLPSRFPSTHSRTDKNKVELAPRPIPSWYMKKKKSRTSAAENLHSKKEELKAQDQERRELFASRFLRSSIFEQDSRRLQHLERKDQHCETGVDKNFALPGHPEVQTECEDGDIPPQPNVLFHSRFLELQQQKDKDICPLVAEMHSVVVEIKHNYVPGRDVLSDKMANTRLKVDEKSVCPHSTMPSTPTVPCLKEMLSTERKGILPLPIETHASSNQEDSVETVLEIAASPPFLKDLKPTSPKPNMSPPPILSEAENEIEAKTEVIQPEPEIGDDLPMEHNHPVEDEPPKQESSGISFEQKNTEFTCSEYTKTKEQCDPKAQIQKTHHSEESKRPEMVHEICIPELQVESKQIPNQRTPKNKRGKPHNILRASPATKNAKDKTATRKSERIDREKLKRGSSPQAEAQKGSLECKIPSKSPIPASNSEQNLESGLVHGRTRRRNVRSVYATIREGEQSGKEAAEPLRTMRKRATDKELVQQDVQIPSTNPRRGRPPKRGIKRVHHILTGKVEIQKTTDGNTEIGDTPIIPEVVKSPEGWRSPRKVQQMPLTVSTLVNKKGRRLDKQSEGATILVELTGTGSCDELELKPKDDSDLTAHLSGTNSQMQKKEQDTALTSADFENPDLTLPKREMAEKTVKMKKQRFKRNTKQFTEDKSHTLRNLEIRVSVDDVKGLLRSENNDHESFPVSIKKTNTLVKSEESISICLPKESKALDVKDTEDAVSESDLPVHPGAVLLAHQMELEQAVENIAKLTDQPPRLYKEPPSGQVPTVPAVVPQSQTEVEEEKRANPSSETELAAAIDSITAEESCADAEGFTAAPAFSALIPTANSLLSGNTREGIETETVNTVVNTIRAADSDDGLLILSPKGLIAESRITEDSSLANTPKKTGKVRPKTQKKSRGRKCAINKKNEDEVRPQPSRFKLPESIPEDPEIINSKAPVITTGTTLVGSVVTAVATCRRDVPSSTTLGTPKEAEQPEVEQPVPKESAFHSDSRVISNGKREAAEPSHSSFTPSPARPPLVSQSGLPLLRPAQLLPNWPLRNEESRIFVSPPCHVTVVTSTVPASTSLGSSSINPPMPPDTKASELHPSSSTLRKILMEPKYVSASNSNSIPSTTVTTTTSDHFQMSENENTSVATGPRHVEDKLSSLPQSIHYKCKPLVESPKNSGENNQHTVISPATSVISRIPIPYDTDETPRISLSNRSMCPLAKPKFKANSSESHRYQGLDFVEDEIRERSVVESTSRSIPGLRVNTSEGVVVLSYSGQKTEGPHRMRAKISQIPPASTGDIEFQQVISKSQIKQDPIIPLSQFPSTKVPSTPSAYGRTGVLLTNKSYNAQPVISSTKPDSHGRDKPEVVYHTASQASVVKMFQEPVSAPQVLMYNQAVIKQHGKRLGTEVPPQNSIQRANHSPIKSPHNPSLSGSRISSSPGMLTDRSVLQPKQDPQSSQSAVLSPSRLVKVCAPSNSPVGTSVVMPHGVSSRAHFNVPVHHPHSEQSSVIIQPHSVTQSVTREPRINASPMPAISFGRRSNSLSSPLPGPVQHSGMSQSIVIRQSHSTPQGSLSTGGGVSSLTDEEHRPFNQALSRTSIPQMQSDITLLQNDRGGLHASLSLDQYRGMYPSMLAHQQLGEQATVETRLPHNSENGTSNISVRKNAELSEKESFKARERQLIHSPSGETRIRAVHTSSPVMVSPHSHGLQLSHTGGVASFPVYHDPRGFPPQITGHPSSGSSTSSQILPEPELGHLCKMPQSLKPESPHLHHSTSSNMSRIPREGVSPSYQSPMTTPIGLNQKPDQSQQKGPAAFLTLSSTSFQPDAKSAHSGHRSIDTVQLLTKYPIMWQGLLALKNEQAAVQLHFVSGNTLLAQRSLPPLEGGPLLRIVQRMRLEASQLDSVARRMTVENDYCLLLALPCGRDQDDVLSQTQALKSGFITYLQAKQAAGIINVPNPGSNQPAYVVQIFPPCDFSESHLSRLAPDLLNSISSISPHLMIVIASV
ncbi:msx2-interacting protein isoform X2 [Hippocampus zosterae]|uniref:msx2-interacting protein isoform X2 n=1 Tax=Hippocampus zosterae TaxID=109293 RepID=UPI00223E0DDE|nr:msx2-interacting protein isoform X2 [Hippocampus zosterae]